MYIIVCKLQKKINKLKLKLITVKCIKGIPFISLILILIYMHVYNSKSNRDKVISLVRDIFVDYVEFNQDQI